MKMRLSRRSKGNRDFDPCICAVLTRGAYRGRRSVIPWRSGQQYGNMNMYRSQTIIILCCNMYGLVLFSAAETSAFLNWVWVGLHCITLRTWSLACMVDEAL